VDYPISNFAHVPIINSKNKEVILFYIPIEEIDTFQSYVQKENPEEILEDKPHVVKKLNEYLQDYLKRAFNFSIEKKLEISYTELVSEILITIYK
jgi:hypothetical protein